MIISKILVHTVVFFFAIRMFSYSSFFGFVRNKIFDCLNAHGFVDGRYRDTCWLEETDQLVNICVCNIRGWHGRLNVRSDIPIIGGANMKQTIRDSDYRKW